MSIPSITLTNSRLSFSVTEIVRHVCVSGAGDCISTTLLRGGNFRFLSYIVTRSLLFFVCKDTGVTLNGPRKTILREH